MAKKPEVISTIVKRYPWTTVKKRETVDQWGYENISFDIWQWNVWKMKWVRLHNTACGFGVLSDASRCAKEMSDEIQEMINNNQNSPAPM